MRSGARLPDESHEMGDAVLGVHPAARQARARQEGCSLDMEVGNAKKPIHRRDRRLAFVLDPHSNALRPRHRVGEIDK